MASANAPDCRGSEDERLSFHDSYACTEPVGDLQILMRNGPDEYTALLRNLQRSAEYFSERDQKRLLDRIYYEQALLHMQHDNWNHALRILLPLWQRLNWRKSGWWALLREVDYALSECARHVSDLGTLIAVQWELLNGFLTPTEGHSKPFSEAIPGLQPGAPKPKVELRAENVISPVSATLAFAPVEAHVGVNLPFQVVLKSQASSKHEPLRIERIVVKFQGILRNFSVQHEDSRGRDALDSAKSLTVQQVSLKDDLIESSEVSSQAPVDRTILRCGNADLTLKAGSTIVLCFNDIPCDPGDTAARSILLCYGNNNFDLEVLTSLEEQLHQDAFFHEVADKIIGSLLYRAQSSAIHVLPKPPKLRLALSTMERNLFVEETFTMSLEVINDEEEEVDVTLQIQFPDEGARGPSICWQDGQASIDPATDPEPDLDRKQKKAEHMLPSESRTHLIDVKTGTQISEHILQIKATYSLKSDPKTQIFLPLEKELVVQRPFESTHSYTPLLHREKWPHSFSLAEAQDGVRTGLIQRFLLTSQLMNVANMAVVVEGAEIEVGEVQEAAHCEARITNELVVAPLPLNGISHVQFTVDVQKNDLDDRRPTYIDLRLKVTWRPDMPEQESMISYLSVPELAIPFGEPRVLATASSLKNPASAIQLDYMLENPSVYSLQFSIMMEVSDEFAFSGSKNILVQLQPLSRQSMRYVLLPLIRGDWITPQLRVYDVVFHKQLKVLGAEGVKTDKKGALSIWVDAPD